MLFSERNGFTQPKQILQIDSMDEDLRNSLWNVMYINFFSQEQINYNYNKLETLLNRMFMNYLKLRIDDFINIGLSEKIYIFKKFFLESVWYKVYESIEFVSQNYEVEYRINIFRESCNNYLEQEKSAYRFIGEQIVPISSEIEVQEIEQSLIITQNTKFKFVNNHLNKALRHFKERENPDYRNSIKEAISAVESLCRLITKESDLEKSLNNLEKFIVINPQLKSGLKKIYAYTNGKEGIRHAQMLDSDVGFDEAKFMLIFCSGFINYLIAKWKDSETNSE